MNAWDLFAADIRNGALSHAYMVSGSDTLAVDEFLRRAAAAAVCTGGADKPCGECLDCKKTYNGTHPDVFSVPEDGKKIVVEDISDLVESCYIHPLESERKVYILKNFDEANEKAQNKLLKILEEPVKNTVFLLGAANMQYVLPTVKSRVKKLTAEDNLAFFLKTAASPEYQSIAGSIADMYTNMRSSADILDFVNTFARFKDLAQGFLNLLELYTRDIILYKTSNIDLLLYKAKKDDIMKAADGYSLAALAGILKNISAARKNLGYNVNLIPVLDNLLYGILEEKHKAPEKE